MTEVRFPWTLFLALALILAGPLAVGIVGGIGGALLLALAWGLAVAAFIVAVRGRPRRSDDRSDRPGPAGRD